MNEIQVDMSLAALILTNPAMQGQVQEIVSTAMSEEKMQGELLWASLVYSGVSLGVQEAERHFTETSQNIIRLIRRCTSAIDKMIAQQSDLETIESMGELRKEFQALLDTRANALKSQKLGELQKFYGIAPEMVMGMATPEMHSPTTMESIGYTLSRRAPLYFLGWCVSVNENIGSTMKCRCASCMSQLVQSGMGEQDETLKAVDAFDGFSKMFREFGVQALHQFREEFITQMEGSNQVHGAETIDAASLTRDMMSNLRKSRAE
jgi:hypothetical protein